MVFTGEKHDTPNKNRELCFSTCEQNDTSNQKPQGSVSFGPKFPPLIGACSLQRPLQRRFADIQREKFSRRVFVLKKLKVKNISEIGLEYFRLFHRR